MTEGDPAKLADQREREADALAQRSQELEAELKQTREDWERKRADDQVPGAPPRPDGEETGHTTSPDPQSPPPSEGPSRAETELGEGPPASTLDDDDG